MTTREQLEAEAEEYVRGTDNGPDGYHGFIAGRTVSAEQVEAAMHGYREGWGAEYNGRRLHQSAIEATFRAAGFYVEEDNNGDNT